MLGCGLFGLLLISLVVRVLVSCWLGICGLVNSVVFFICSYMCLFVLFGGCVCFV